MTDGDWGQQMKCSTQNVHFCSDFNTLAHVKHFGGFLRGGSGMGGGYKEYFYINTVLYCTEGGYPEGARKLFLIGRVVRRIKCWPKNLQ